jgi:hypothetical protein
MLLLHLHACGTTTLGSQAQDRFPCFLDLSLPIVSEQSVLHADAAQLLEEG